MTNLRQRGATTAQCYAVKAQSYAFAGGACTQQNLQQISDLTLQQEQQVSKTSYRSSAEWLFTMDDDDCVPDYLTRNVFGYCEGFHQRYLLGPIVGQGSWGLVREVRDLLSIGPQAVKIIKKRHPKSGQITVGYLKKIRNEVQLLGAMRGCSQVVQLFRVFEDKDNVYLVMQLCEGGSLADCRRVRTEQEIAFIIKNVMKFVAECHGREIIYRDVKPSNFIFESEEIGSRLIAVDMGLAARHYIEDKNLRSRTGTPAYMAPEVINKNYSYKADVWSVGCLAYQLIVGSLPWATAAARYADVLQSILDTQIDFSHLHGKVSYEAIDFLSNVLVKDPELRFDADEALFHPWLLKATQPENSKELTTSSASFTSR